MWLRGRWDIEVFFKEIKQTLQLSDFLGYSANAVRWQEWKGLLVHLLMRCNRASAEFSADIRSGS
jgi:IS4 transposase